jgi:hypothetical protein
MRSRNKRPPILIRTAVVRSGTNRPAKGLAPHAASGPISKGENAESARVLRDDGLYAVNGGSSLGASNPSYADVMVRGCCDGSHWG